MDGWLLAFSDALACQSWVVAFCGMAVDVQAINDFVLCLHVSKELSIDKAGGGGRRRGS